MKKSRIPAFVAAAVVLYGVFVILPSEVYAQEGIVPSGRDGDYNPDGFGSCEFVATINNTIRFLVGITGILAVIAFMYAGFLMVVSRGDTAVIQQAKSIFTNVLIGFVILLSAFLVINTIMSMLVGSTSSLVNWNRIECSYAREAPDPPEFAIESETENYDVAIDEPGVGGGHFRINPGGNFSADSGAGSLSSCSVAGGGPCGVAAMEQAGFGSLANDAALIVGAESGCNPNAESRTDTTTDGRTYSVGTWQINLAFHALSCTLSNGQQINLNCPSAFEAAGYRNQYNVQVQRVVNEELYTQCVTYAKDPQCNNQIAAGLARDSGDMGDWACSAKKCGVSTSRNHLCPL